MNRLRVDGGASANMRQKNNSRRVASPSSNPAHFAMKRIHGGQDDLRSSFTIGKVDRERLKGHTKDDKYTFL